MAWNQLEVSRDFQTFILDLFSYFAHLNSNGLKENKKRDKLHHRGFGLVCILKSVNETDLWCVQVMSKLSYL